MGAFPFTRPQRCVLIDSERDISDPLRATPVLINPDSWRTRGGAEWPLLDVPGYSSQVAQWSHTKSIEHSFTVAWTYAHSSNLRRSRGGTEVNANFYHWLLAFTHPVAPGRAPALMEIYWPNYLWIAVQVETVDVQIKRWSQEGVPLEYTADLSVREIRQQFMTRDFFFNTKRALPHQTPQSGPPWTEDPTG